MSMKIKLKYDDVTLIKIGWMHLIFVGIVLFIGFCVLVAGVLSL